MKYHVQIAMIMTVEADTIELAESLVDNAIDGNELRRHKITVNTRNTMASEYEREPIQITIPVL